MECETFIISRMKFILRGENVKPDKNLSKRLTYAKQELMRTNWHAIGGNYRVVSSSKITQKRDNNINNQPLKNPITFISDINIRGRERDDSSFPPKPAETPAVTVSLPQRKPYQT